MNAPAEFFLPPQDRTDARLPPAHQRSFLDQLLHDNVQEQNGLATATFKEYQLSSAFQPIFGLAHGRPVGYEALLRATNAAGAAVSPLQVFGSVETTEGIVHLDRTSRMLHASNYRSLARADSWLFLNINPRVVIEGSLYGPFFAELLAHSGLAPSQVVVEILENEITDEGQLAESVRYYKDLGCLVAIDDFGAGHSNFDRILRLAPDMVKLDRSLLQQARSNSVARRMLPSLVALLHEAGCLVVLEGIEDEAEALLAMEADADFAQGYFFARPAPAAQLHIAPRSLFDSLSRAARAGLHGEATRHAAALQPCSRAFEQCSARYAAGTALQEAAAPLFASSDVLRCYVLDEAGVQLGGNLVPPHSRTTLHPRYAPLRATTGCNWSGRSYFRRAIAEPGTMQITRPYFSVTDAAMNITLSQAVRRGTAWHVVCCDIRYPLNGMV